MKPNWKAFAKEAFQRGWKSGYEARQRDEAELASEWIPVTTPPEPGRYLCRLIYEKDGQYHSETDMLTYCDSIGFSNYSENGHIVTHWLKPPKYPEVFILLGRKSAGNYKTWSPIDVDD